MNYSYKRLYSCVAIWMIISAILYLVISMIKPDNINVVTLAKLFTARAISYMLINYFYRDFIYNKKLMEFDIIWKILASWFIAGLPFVLNNEVKL